MLSRLLFAGCILLFFVVPLINGSMELSADAMIFPWLIGGLGSVLVAWEIVDEFIKIRRRTSKEATQEITLAQVKAFLPGAAWILVILPMIYLIGFILTIPVYLFLCFKFNGEKWQLSLLLAAIAGIIFYVGFVYFIGLRFYEGLLISYIKG